MIYLFYMGSCTILYDLYWMLYDFILVTLEVL